MTIAKKRYLAIGTLLGALTAFGFLTSPAHAMLQDGNAGSSGTQPRVVNPVADLDGASRNSAGSCRLTGSESTFGHRDEAGSSPLHANPHQSRYDDTPLDARPESSVLANGEARDHNPSPIPPPTPLNPLGDTGNQRENSGNPQAQVPPNPFKDWTSLDDLLRALEAIESERARPPQVAHGGSALASLDDDDPNVSAIGSAAAAAADESRPGSSAPEWIPEPWVRPPVELLNMNYSDHQEELARRLHAAESNYFQSLERMGYLRPHLSATNAAVSTSDGVPGGIQVGPPESASAPTAIELARPDVDLSPMAAQSFPSLHAALHSGNVGSVRLPDRLMFDASPYPTVPLDQLQRLFTDFAQRAPCPSGAVSYVCLEADGPSYLICFANGDRVEFI